MKNTTERINFLYYAKDNPGRRDYWKKMAAPVFRAKRILEIVRERQPETVVDLGCGGGDLLFEIREHFPQIKLYGLDFSEQQIDQNRKNLANINWVITDLGKENAIPKNLVGKFDMVISSELIEHLPDPVTLLKNAWLLAKDREGSLVISTQSGTLRETERRVGHVQHFSPQRIKEMLLENGWAVKRVWNEGWPFHNFSKWFANLNAENTMRLFSGKAYGPYQRFVCATLRLLFTFNSKKSGAQLYAIGVKTEKGI